MYTPRLIEGGGLFTVSSNGRVMTKLIQLYGTMYERSGSNVFGYYTQWVNRTTLSWWYGLYQLDEDRELSIW